MNKLLIAFLLFSGSILAQNEYATINIYRPQAMLGSAFPVDILINGIQVFKLSSGGHLVYKAYNLKPTTITIKSAGIASAQIIPEQNGHYYFKTSPQWSGFTLEQIGEPVESKKLKKKKYKELTDIGFQQNVLVYNHPKTEWTKTKLIEHWNNNGISKIEGIYERVGKNFEYNLAVFKENNEYSLIYLSGAGYSSWEEGDLKAEMQKTAQFGLFKVNWYMFNKSTNKDIILTFKDATMSCISETANLTNDLYIKIYPTYDEGNNLSKPEWRSSGTGFFIDNKGYIVTNYHVIDKGTVFEINVTKKGTTSSYNAEIISVDKQNDLAILKINDPNFVPLTKLNYNFNSRTQDVGSSVFALGYPLTQIMGSEIKFTDGKISSKSGFQGNITTYQISVPIQPGNSGGPLFDKKGNLVGITSSGVNRNLDLTENVNYAIKTSYLSLLIDATNDEIEVPKVNELEQQSLTEQIKILSEYVVHIKVK